MKIIQYSQINLFRFVQDALPPTWLNTMLLTEMKLTNHNNKHLQHEFKQYET